MAGPGTGRVQVTLARAATSDPTSVSLLCPPGTTLYSVPLEGRVLPEPPAPAGPAGAGPLPVRRLPIKLIRGGYKPMAGGSPGEREGRLSEREPTGRRPGGEPGGHQAGGRVARRNAWWRESGEDSQLRRSRSGPDGPAAPPRRWRRMRKPSGFRTLPGRTPPEGGLLQVGF